MKKINIIGAIDRFNYGDLLFPHIIEKEFSSLLGDSFSFSYFGLVRSDYRKFGAKPSNNLREFYKCSDDDNVNIIIAGGEALGATYSKLLSFISSNFKFFNDSYKINKIIDMEAVSKLILGGKTKYPFVLSKKDFNNNPKVFYNSLGGSGLGNISKVDMMKIINSVNDADYFSVRDSKTLKNFTDSGCCSARLVPDSAILVSEFYSQQYLESNCSISTRKKIDGILGEYVFFQVGKYKSGNEVNVIIDELRKIHKNLGCPIVLCPIGTAPGHEDQQPLKFIHDSLPLDTLYFEGLSIWEIMYLISNSALYIGTSLHGVITAMSYSVPYLGMNKKILKLQAYLETWGHEALNRNVEFNEISNFASNVIDVDKHEINKMTNDQKKLVHASFCEIGRNFNG